MRCRTPKSPQRDGQAGLRLPRGMVLLTLGSESRLDINGLGSPSSRPCLDASHGGPNDRCIGGLGGDKIGATDGQDMHNSNAGLASDGSDERIGLDPGSA
jgi:hypothetical protein